MKDLREEDYDRLIYLADGIVIAIFGVVYALVIFCFIGRYFLKKLKQIR